MKVKINWRRLVKQINGFPPGGWNRSQGLGMIYLGESMDGDGIGGAAHWQAGNCQIFVSSWTRAQSLVELITTDRPADVAAQSTWRALRELLEGKSLIVSADSSPDLQPERMIPRRKIRLGTQASIQRLHEIKTEALRGHKPIPTRAFAMCAAGITDKTWKLHAPDLYANWYQQTQVKAARERTE